MSHLENKEACAARVLVADDSLLVRTIVRKGLQQAGYLVDEAADGAAALRLLGGREYDVVVTDLNMPELDGLGLLAAVKNRSLDTEVVILTGTHASDVSAAIQALRLGAHDYLTKPPSSPDEILLTVERAAEKKRLRVANRQLLKQLEALSRTDGLTGLLNRRCCDEAVPREAGRARRYGFPLALAFLDLDHFKRINDAHGHAAGDVVLKRFAGLLLQEFRETDSVFRYGGEEFVALLPHVDQAGAVTAIERFLGVVRNTPVTLGGTTLRVTSSAGVGMLRAADKDGSDLVKQADTAVYAAKSAGRDRCCTAPPARLRRPERVA